MKHKKSHRNRSNSNGIWYLVRKVTKKMKKRPLHSFFINFDPILKKLDSNEFRTPADWYRAVMNLYENARKSQNDELTHDVFDQLIYQFQKAAVGLNISTVNQWCASVQDQFRNFDSLLISCPYPFLIDSQLISLVEDSANSFQLSSPGSLSRVVSDIKRLAANDRKPDPEHDIQNFYLGAFRDKLIDMDDFRMVRELGSGSYATVTLEEYIPTGQLVAVKTINERENSFSQRAIECFCREVSILAMHQHDFILPFFGFTNIDRNGNNALIIATDYMEHGTLRDLLNLESLGNHPKKIWNSTKKSIVALGIACGMKFLHQCKVVHRDLKSLNILMDDNYEPKIADMGFAKFLHEGEIQTMRIGSYPWMAPEVISTHTYNEKADIYSFAMILYEMLTLKYPFSGQTVSSIQCQVLTNQRPPIVPPTDEENENDNKNAFELNRGLIHLIQNCWSQSPDERPSFSEIVDSFIAEECLFGGTNVELFRAFVMKLKKEKIDHSFKMNMVIAAKNNFIEITKMLIDDPETNLNEVVTNNDNENDNDNNNENNNNIDDDDDDDCQGQSAVHIAIRHDFIKLLKLLINVDDVDVNITDCHSMAPIHYAVVESKNEASMRLLLTRYDCLVNARDGKGNTALHLAVKKKADDLVLLLLSRRDCNVNAVNAAGDTPLTLAIKGNSRSIVQKLISTCRLKMDIPQHKDILNEAILRNNVETVKLLLQIPGINVNECHGKVTNKPNKPLSMTSRLSNAEKASSSASSSAFPTILNSNDSSTNGLTTSTTVQPNIGSNSGYKTPLMNAIQSKNPLILMQIMSVPQLDLSPETITQLIRECIMVNDLLFLRILLSMNNVDLNYSLQEAVAPLILAAHIGNIEAVSMLINNPRIDVNVQEYSSLFTALHIAVQSDRIDIVKLLMANARVNPNIENRWKQTPMKLAASNPAIRKLLKRES